MDGPHSGIFWVYEVIKGYYCFSLPRACSALKKLKHVSDISMDLHWLSVLCKMRYSIVK